MCILYFYVLCKCTLFPPDILLMYRSEINIIASMLISVMQPERSTLFLHYLQCLLSCFLGIFSPLCFPVLMPQEVEPLTWFLVQVMLIFGLLSALAWLPFSFNTTSPALICSNLSMSFFQFFATNLLSLIQYVDSQCWVTMHGSMAQFSTSSRGIFS